MGQTRLGESSSQAWGAEADPQIVGWLAPQGHTHHQEGWIAQRGNVRCALVLSGRSSLSGSPGSALSSIATDTRPVARIEVQPRHARQRTQRYVPQRHFSASPVVPQRHFSCMDQVHSPCSACIIMFALTYPWPSTRCFSTSAGPGMHAASHSRRPVPTTLVVA